MRFLRNWSDPDRWEWFAAGDESVASATHIRGRASNDDNSSEQLLWQAGLVIAIPLAIAALIQIIFAA